MNKETKLRIHNITAKAALKCESEAWVQNIYIYMQFSEFLKSKIFESIAQMFWSEWSDILVQIRIIIRVLFSVTIKT